MSLIKILIAEDHQMFRKGIAAILNNHGSFAVVGEAANGIEIIEMAERLEPDLILMDVHLPEVSGVQATIQILDKIPTIKILGLSNEEEEEEVVKMIRAGVKGYVLKDTTTNELIQAIQTLINGNSYFSNRVSNKLLSRLDTSEKTIKELEDESQRALTCREAEILKYITEEMTNKEIADQLFISPRTVETHRRNLIQKLKVRNTVGLVKYYINRNRKVRI